MAHVCVGARLAGQRKDIRETFLFPRSDEFSLDHVADRQPVKMLGVPGDDADHDIAIRDNAHREVFAFALFHHNQIPHVVFTHQAGCVSDLFVSPNNDDLSRANFTYRHDDPPLSDSATMADISWGGA
jgi:hypothetical protein